MAQAKYALVVGCNYPNTPAQLSGCINDANSMHEILIKRFGFKETNITVLTDKPSSDIKPTAALIKAVLREILCVSKAGDVVFLSFAGHGTIVPATDSSSGKDEQAIVTSDFNLITCMDFRRILNGTPSGVSFVIMSDSCHSGGLIDKETEQIGPNRPPMNLNIFNSISPHLPPIIRIIPFEVILRILARHIQIHVLNVPAFFVQLFTSEASLVFQNLSPHQMELRLKVDQGILLSACQPDELAKEKNFRGKTHGVFTSAVLDVLENHPKPIINWELLTRARKFVEKLQEKQHPCLYCSDKNALAFFLCQ